MKTRKLLPLALFCLLSCLLSCLLTTAGYGSASLVQSNIGGSTSTTFTSGGTLSATGGFTNPTMPGSTLVAAIKIREDAISGEVHNVLAGAYSCTAPGFSWVSTASTAVNSFIDDATATHGGWEFFCYITNASSMSVNTTVGVVTHADHMTAAIEFSLFEFAGALAYAELIGGAAQTSGAASAPNGGLGIGATARLLLYNLVGYPGSNLTAASGWTLGPNDTVATIGQTEYALSLSGTNTTQFVGTLTLYATHAIVFSLVSSSVVPRHRGFVN